MFVSRKKFKSKIHSASTDLEKKKTMKKLNDFGNCLINYAFLEDFLLYLIAVVYLFGDYLTC